MYGDNTNIAGFLFNFLLKNFAIFNVFVNNFFASFVHYKTNKLYYFLTDIGKNDYAPY